MKMTLLRTTAATVFAVIALAIPFAAHSGKVTKVTTPVISQVDATLFSIDVQVTAPLGGTGLPGGFSLQWMTLDDYTANNNTWYLSDDLRLCKASFSGNANLSRYNLKAGESTVVRVGEFLFDEGASTSCPGALECGTTYVFHAFGHATSSLTKSDLTPNVQMATLSCGGSTVCREYPDGYGGASYGNCTVTQGYWKSHGYIPTGNNWDEWAFTSLTLGSVSYTQADIQSIFNQPAAGNGLIALAHQLIAAKININQGAVADANTAAAIAAADALIGGLVVPPVGTGTLSSSATSALISALTDFNEGVVGPGHCGGSDDGCTRPSAPQ